VVDQLVAGFERYAAAVQEAGEQVEPRYDQDELAADDNVVGIAQPLQCRIPEGAGLCESKSSTLIVGTRDAPRAGSDPTERSSSGQ
jgi:hypothetical protein